MSGAKVDATRTAHVDRAHIVSVPLRPSLHIPATPSLTPLKANIDNKLVHAKHTSKYVLHCGLVSSHANNSLPAALGGSPSMERETESEATTTPNHSTSSLHLLAD